MGASGSVVRHSDAWPRLCRSIDGSVMIMIATNYLECAFNASHAIRLKTVMKGAYFGCLSMEDFNSTHGPTNIIMCAEQKYPSTLIDGSYGTHFSFQKVLFGLSDFNQLLWHYVLFICSLSLCGALLHRAQMSGPTLSSFHIDRACPLYVRLKILSHSAKVSNACARAHSPHF